MSIDSRWVKLRKAFARAPKTPAREYSLEELIGVKRRGKTGIAERVEPSETLMRRSELLYRLEPLIFSGVNKLTRRITCSKVYFSGGTEEENEKASKFFESSGALGLLSHLVKDAFIYGFGLGEINWDARNKTTITQIYPMEFDYKREGGEIKLDAEGNPEGYVWKKKGITDIPLAGKEVLLIRFYSLGEYCLGISPIEAAFKTAWIKLNLQEALGETVYRHGFPLFHFTIGSSTSPTYSEITPEKLKQAKKIIGNIDTVSELILPWWITVNTLKTGDVSTIHPFLELLSMEILAALEMPKAFGVETKGLGGRAVEEMDFEKTILAMQEELKRQLEEQLLFPYFEKAKFISIPRIQFTEYAPELQNIKLRRMSAYARHGLITRTDELENELRKQEGFPLKKRKRKIEEADKCIFALGKCPVREEEDMPLDKLSAFCNICVKRRKAESKLELKVRKGNGSSESQES